MASSGGPAGSWRSAASKSTRHEGSLRVTFCAALARRVTADSPPAEGFAPGTVAVSRSARMPITAPATLATAPAPATTPIQVRAAGARGALGSGATGPAGHDAIWGAVVEGPPRGRRRSAALLLSVAATVDARGEGAIAVGANAAVTACPGPIAVGPIAVD